MKTKFVTVQPRSNKAKNRFANMMDHLHSCKVQQEDEEKMFLNQSVDVTSSGFRKTMILTGPSLNSTTTKSRMNTPEKHEKRRDVTWSFC